MSTVPHLQFDQLRNMNILPDVRAHAQEAGLPAAMVAIMAAANVRLTITGDTEGWQNPGRPVLALGDHSKGLESLLILGACGVVGRRDVRVTAKPYALTGQLVNALSGEEEVMIGLIPRSMTAGRRGGDLGTRLHRAAFREQLASPEETNAYNAASMARTSKALQGGELVIFPTGGVYDAARAPWRKGVGILATSLSSEVFANTLVVPFKFSGINPRRIMSAVAKSRLGMRPRRQDIAVEFGTQRTLGELFVNGPGDSAAHITEVLRTNYQQDFSPFRST